MAQVGINEAHAGGPSVYDLSKLEPKNKGEIARIGIIEPDHISAEYRHSIGGQKFSTQVWGGQFLCIGNTAALEQNGEDPTNCPLCRLAAQGAPVTKAQRKFVTQVIRYGTDPVGNVMSPFSAVQLVWMFGDKEYRALVQLQQSWGNLAERDLLFTAESKDFKTWTFQPQPQCTWRSDQSILDYVWAVWSQGKAPLHDLDLIIGKRASAAEMEAKVAEVQQQMAGGAPQVPQTGFPQAPGVPPMNAPIPGLPTPPDQAAPPVQLPLPTAPAAVAPPMPQLPVTPSPAPQAPAPQAPAAVAPPVPQAPTAPAAPAPAMTVPTPPVMETPMAGPFDDTPPAPSVMAPAAAPAAPPVPQAPVAPVPQAPAAAVPPTPQPEATPPAPMDFASLLNVPTVPTAGA